MRSSTVPPANAGIAEDHVECPELVHGGLNHPLDTGLFGYVDVHGGRLAPKRTNMVGGLVCGGDIDICTGDRCSRFSHRLREPFSEATACSRDQHYFPA
jgi:hypothetical protein